MPAPPHPATRRTGINLTIALQRRWRNRLALPERAGGFPDKREPKPFPIGDH
jgi:hypothetical protein